MLTSTSKHYRIKSPIMKTIITTTIAMLFCIMSEGNTRKADRLFNRWEYYKAAELYKKEVLKNPSQDVYYKLGECYRKMEQYSEAKNWYDKVNKEGFYHNTLFYYNYGLVLENNEEYLLAKESFRKYDSLMPSDARGKFHMASCELALKYNKDKLTDTVVNVIALNTKYAEFSPVWYKDGIVFASSRSTEDHHLIYGWNGEYYLDLFYAKLEKDNDNYTSFDTVIPLDEENVVNQKYHDATASFSQHFDTIFFTRVEKELRGEARWNLGIERNKIYSAVYKEGEWTDLTPFTFNNDSFSVSHPFISKDGKHLYFVSDMPGGFGETDIYVSHRDSNGWNKPVNLGPSVNTFGQERFPTLDSAGNLYFSSDGYAGLGGMEICVATYQDGEFVHTIPLKPPFNSSANDFGIIFLPGHTSGYFASNRNGGDDLYYFEPKEGKIELVTTDSFPEQELKKEIKFKIYFDFDKYAIRSDAISTLDSVVAYLQKDPELKIELDGHADSRGSYEYNIILSQNRSEAAMKYIVSKGIAMDRMTTIAYGYTQLANHCTKFVPCSEEKHQVNRRVDFIFPPEKRYVSDSPLKRDVFVQ